MELSPRALPDTPGTGAPRRRRSPWAYGVVALVLIGMAVVAYQGLTSASLYFYNADEAVAKRAELDGDRIRVQGLVRDDVEPKRFGDGDTGIAFTIAFNGVELPVEHRGDPPELFQPGLPVVLEGSFGGSREVFGSDRIIVKHSEQYEADNGDRLDDAQDAESVEPSAP